MAVEAQTGVPDGWSIAADPSVPPPSSGASGSVGTRFAEGAWKNLNPTGLVQAVRHPIDTLGALIDAQVEQIQQAKSLYDQQRYSEAAGHLGAGLLPLVGPPAAKAGERIGSGDVAGGLGEATGLLASLQAPKAIAKTAGAVTSGAARAIEALPKGGIVADVAPDLVGLVSPRAAHGLRAAQRVARAVSGPEPAVVLAGPVDPAAPHLDTSVPVRPSDLTQAQLAERMFYGQDQGPRAAPAVKPPLGQRVSGVIDVLPPDVAPAPPGAALLDGPAPPGATGAPAAVPPSPPGSAGPVVAPPVANPLPDQKALNEAALAARRAAYQARVQAAAEADAAAQTPAPARIKLTAPESAEYLRLRQAGMTDPQAVEALQAARAFQARFGTPTPTVAETRFPKR